MTRRNEVTTLGNADPHSRQNDLLCRVAGNVNCLILSWPESQMSLPVDVNRLDACADPVSFRQYSQWHK